MFAEGGIEALTRFDGGGGLSRLSVEQESALVSWISETLPRSTRQIGAHIAMEFDVVYVIDPDAMSLQTKRGADLYVAATRATQVMHLVDWTS